jgi:hypothetical protein
VVLLSPCAEEIGEGGMVHDKCPQTTDDRVGGVKVGARRVVGSAVVDSGAGT